MVWKSAPVPATFAERNLEAVREYYEEHGNIDIPLTYRTESGIMLGHWIRHQKELKRRLSKNRIAILEKYGIDWKIED